METTQLEEGRLGYGLDALRRELDRQGGDTAAWLDASGVDTTRSSTDLDYERRLALLRNAVQYVTRPDTALRAGADQRISDFGLYGFAMVTSSTFGEAFDFGTQHMELAGPVLRITYQRDGDTGVLRSHDAHSLGSALPFIAEFWRSSMTTLLGHVLGDRFPSVAMYFPYRAPAHAAAYRRLFGCPIEFESPIMEWHFDASVMERPCPNANDAMTRVCQQFCERMVKGDGTGSTLERQVRSLCLARPGYNPSAKDVARSLGMSLRTLYRRLADEGLRFQSLLDQTRLSIALEYLENTRIPVEEVGRRVGFEDASNFRKAFRRWSGRAPSDIRRDAIPLR